MPKVTKPRSKRGGAASVLAVKQNKPPSVEPQSLWFLCCIQQSRYCPCDGSATVHHIDRFASKAEAEQKMVDIWVDDDIAQCCGNTWHKENDSIGCVDCDAWRRMPLKQLHQLQEEKALDNGERPMFSFEIKKIEKKK